MHSKSSEVAPLEALRQKFLHSANQARTCQMLQEAEALVKDVTALGRWPSTSFRNPTERILIRRIKKLRDAHASGALQPAVDGAAQPTVIAQLEDLQRKFLQEAADRMLEEAEDAVDPMLAFADEAHNKIEQELLILAFGNRTKSMLRRLKLYKAFVQDPTTSETEFTKRYGDKVARGSTTHSSKGMIFYAARCSTYSILTSVPCPVSVSRTGQLQKW